MIEIKNLSVQFTGENLFENVNLKISRNDKISLVGSNGKGKSTFLKLIFGLEQPETGQIIKQKGIQTGYLPQDLISFKGKTLFEEVKSSLMEIENIIGRETAVLEELNSSLLTEEKRDELIQVLGDLHYKKEHLDYYSSESRIEKVLTCFGFTEKDFNRKTEEFSGGWQMRIQMAKILLAQNDLILLDEPTNHLDIDTLTWLEEYLQKYEGVLIVVSHDRHFINSVTNKTLEIFNNEMNFFPGNFEQYLEYKKERDRHLRASAVNLEKKRKETERFIERFRYKATKARQVQSRIKQLEKFESVDLMEDEKIIDIKFPDPPRSGAIPVELKEVSKSYGKLNVLKNVNIQILRGDKIAIVGPNGAGKTTLAKIIGKKIFRDYGELNYGHNTIISYYEQEVAESLNPDNDLIDSLEEVNDELNPGQIRKILGSFLFSGEDVFKKIGVLSGGEKSRVALSRLLLTKSNFIILDEPTNHLDFSSKQILQKALIDFQGTLLIVSHDIDFIQPIVNKVIEIRNQVLKLFSGGIDYYLRKREEEYFVNNQTISLNDEKISRKDQKRAEAELRQKKFFLTKNLRTDLENSEAEIHDLEKRKTVIEQELSQPEVYSNPEISKEKNLEYSKVKSLLDIEFRRWSELSLKLDEIEKSFE